MTGNGERFREFAEFPFETCVVDHSGQQRMFQMSLNVIPTGEFVVYAQELPLEEDGYRFSAMSSSSPYQALGKLRDKIRQSITTRYLYRENDGRWRMTRDDLSGRIVGDGLIIDGEWLSFDEVITLMQVYEGFSVRFTFADLLDERHT